MAMRTKMAIPTDDDDDLDVEALRMAALQTLKKSSAPTSSVQPQNMPLNVKCVNHINNVPGGSRTMQQNRGRGNRGAMSGMRRGMPRGRGVYPQNFFPSRPSGNSNLITIVPTVLDEDKPTNDNHQKGFDLKVKPSGSPLTDSTELEKVPAKFRRLDDDSESEESDDDQKVKSGSEEAESSDEDEGEEIDMKSDTDSDRDGLVTLQHEDEEDDDSLERLMRELEEEISETPKDKPAASVKDLNRDKMPKLRKVKKEKRKREKVGKDPVPSDVVPASLHDRPVVKADSLNHSVLPPKLVARPPGVRSRSPLRQQCSSGPAACAAPPALPSSPRRRTPSPRSTRSPARLRSRSPRRSRSPVKARSPRRSRSPPRGRYPSRSPHRSPRRSPYFAAPRSGSPPRLPPLRSRSRSRSPLRAAYARRSRSASPLRRQSPYRRSRSRSPGAPPGRPYSSRRSPSPRARRSPLYAKKMSPARRSVSPRRRSISPRRRTPSPRRRSVSPRRRSVSPRRRVASPAWAPRSRSPRPASPRRASPYATRRPASPRGGMYRSPSPSSRHALRRRSPAGMGGAGAGAPRRSPPHHRVARSPPKQSHGGASPGRGGEKPKQLSPVARNSQRLPSPRRQRSPVLYSRGQLSSKPLSPAHKVSPAAGSSKKSQSPPRELGRDLSPLDSLSLSPSPERQTVARAYDDRNRNRKSHPLGESHGESKKSRTDLRNVLPRRKDLPKSEDVAVHTDDALKRERREKKKERKRELRKHKRDPNNVLEARRRKFESSGPVEVSVKKIRLRNKTCDITEPEEQELTSKDVEFNIEREKERELKEVNEVDESILDRELMGGVDLLWSDEEEQLQEEEEELEEGEEEEDEVHAATSNVQFKRTFNLSSASGTSGKENIPDDSHDSKKDEENPLSRTGSPLHSMMRDEVSDPEECDAPSESSGEVDDPNCDLETQEAWPKTNRELKEYILSQVKSAGAGALVRLPKQPTIESHHRSKSNDSDVDLRAELSRRRAERLTKVNSCVETLPGRLLQSALQGVGVKSRRDKGHQRRTRSPSFEDDADQQESDGRRVLVLRRAVEQKEPAINITISKVDSLKESSTLKISGKLPIHMRLGIGKKGDDSPKKVKLKRNVTVGRKKQV